MLTEEKRVNYCHKDYYMFISVSYTHLDTNNSEIAYITVKVNNMNATAMIDTGANVSLIDKMELDRIQSENKVTIPTLPINNLSLIHI